MSDLDDLLHRTATSPRRPVDPAQLVREGARRRRRRHRVQAAAGAAVGALVLVAALALPGLREGDDGAPVELVEVPDAGAAAAPEPAVPPGTAPTPAAPPAPAPATPSPAPTTTGGTYDGPPPTDPAPVALGALAPAVGYGPGGLWVAAGRDPQQVIRPEGRRIARAHAVDSGVAFQIEGSDDILFAPFEGDASVVVPAEPDTPTVLHGARTTDEGVVVLFTRRPPAGDPERDEVVLTQVIGGEQREIDRYGAIELSTPAVTWDDDGVVAATCHLTCVLRRLGGPGPDADLAIPAEALPQTTILAVRAVEDRYVLVVAPLREDGSDGPLELVEVVRGSGELLSRTPLGLGAGDEPIGEVALHEVGGPSGGPAGDGREWMVSASRMGSDHAQVQGIDVVRVTPASGVVSPLHGIGLAVVPLGEAPFLGGMAGTGDDS